MPQRSNISPPPTVTLEWIEESASQKQCDGWYKHPLGQALFVLASDQSAPAFCSQSSVWFAPPKLSIQAFRGFAHQEQLLATDHLVSPELSQLALERGTTSWEAPMLAHPRVRLLLLSVVGSKTAPPRIPRRKDRTGFSTRHAGRADKACRTEIENFVGLSGDR